MLRRFVGCKAQHSGCYLAGRVSLAQSLVGGHSGQSARLGAVQEDGLQRELISSRKCKQVTGSLPPSSDKISKISTSFVAAFSVGDDANSVNLIVIILMLYLLPGAILIFKWSVAICI